MAQPMRSGGLRRRRSMSEINMVPFIDVMLVLLIIFMVTAPLITTGVVDLPKVGATTKAVPKVVVEVIVAVDGSVKFKVNGQEEARSVPVRRVAERATELQRGVATAGAMTWPALRCRMLENSSMKVSNWIAMRSMSRAKRL